MLAIKLKRTGKKHQASYRVVVAERRSKLGGRSTEDVGWLNPHNKKNDLKKDRILYWISVGAQPTSTVHNLLVKEGVLKAAKVSTHKKPKKAAETTTKPAPAA